MSLNTWKEEYYPVPTKDASRKTALEMSELKWLGLRPEALRKHELRKSGRYITELPNNYNSFSSNLSIDGSSCHLCQLYADAGQGCVECPIILYKQKEGLLSLDCDESCGPEYLMWVHTGDPEPMIRLIQATRKEE